jgi:predicted ATPase
MSLTESLAAVIGGRHTLIVLDNCEHVIDAGADLCHRLLRSGPDLRMLATSRAPLHVEGEVRFPLEPLAVPAPGAAADEAGRWAAVALFVERARAVNPDFELTPASVEAVTTIVRRLDGMPLAIELAAAQFDTLGLDQLLASLDDRFRFLVSPIRGVSRRQASLGATVEWSYRLLDEAERRAFRRLAVFPAPFTLAAAAATTGGPADLAARLVRRFLLHAPAPEPMGGPATPCPRRSALTRSSGSRRAASASRQRRPWPPGCSPRRSGSPPALPGRTMGWPAAGSSWARKDLVV